MVQATTPTMPNASHCIPRALRILGGWMATPNGVDHLGAARTAERMNRDAATRERRPRMRRVTGSCGDLCEVQAFLLTAGSGAIDVPHTSDGRARAARVSVTVLDAVTE